MKKKILTYILVSIISLQFIAGAQLVASATETEAIQEATPKILIAEMADGKEKPTNKLVTPKPSLLPGPTTATQEQSKGVREWLVSTILPRWATMLVGFVGTVAFLMLIISGVRYLTAYGNEEAATSARKMIIYSIIGLLLALFSYTIVKIIINLKFLT